MKTKKKLYGSRPLERFSDLDEFIETYLPKEKIKFIHSRSLGSTINYFSSRSSELRRKRLHEQFSGYNYAKN